MLTPPVERAIRLGPEEFLLVLPSQDQPTLLARAERIRAAVLDLARTFPYVPTPTTAALTRTRARPLPISALWAALDHATRAGHPITVLPAT